jgi:hypothetical protein
MYEVDGRLDLLNRWLLLEFADDRGRRTTFETRRGWDRVTAVPPTMAMAMAFAPSFASLPSVPSFASVSTSTLRRIEAGPLMESGPLRRSTVGSEGETTIMDRMMAEAEASKAAARGAQ